MFHVAMWRERMRDALKATVEGRVYELPGQRDEINDEELARGIGTPIGDAAARADQLLSEILELYPQAGDRQVHWFRDAPAADVVLRNSYSHPRRHICDYRLANGDVDGARKSLDEALSELAALGAGDYVTGILTELRDDPRLKIEAG